jgi:hypothetical protein
LIALGLIAGNSACGAAAASESSTEALRPVAAAIRRLVESDINDRARRQWPEFVARYRPTLSWREWSEWGNLLWIERGPGGEKFTIESAYYYLLERARADQWLLGEPVSLRDMETSDQWGWCCYVRKPARWTVELSERAPPFDEDGVAERTYAVAKSHHPKFGTVYELGCCTETDSLSGTMHARELQRFYVARDRAGIWHFLGKGPASGTSSGAGQKGTRTMVESTSLQWGEVGWLPVTIEFEVRTIQCAFNPDASSAPDLETRQRSRLRAVEPGDVHEEDTCVDVDRPYLVAASGDTLQTIAAHLSLWCPGGGWQPYDERSKAEHARATPLWQRELRRLNRGLSSGEIPAGTRIELLTLAEADEVFRRNSP